MGRIFLNTENFVTYPHPQPNPLVKGTKMSRIQNTPVNTNRFLKCDFAPEQRVPVNHTVQSGDPDQHGFSSFWESGSATK
jgi:hypothetical protein